MTLHAYNPFASRKKEMVAMLKTNKQTNKHKGGKATLEGSQDLGFTPDPASNSLCDLAQDNLHLSFQIGAKLILDLLVLQAFNL